MTQNVKGPTRKTPSRSATARRSMSPQREWFTITNIGLVLVALLIGLVIYAVYESVRARTEATQPIEGLEEFPNQAQGHQEGTLTYEQTPPVGGVHNPVWQNCGVYTTPIASENAVHSLEHGAIWITYQPELDPEQVTELQQLTRASGYRLLSPFPGLPSPIVASAWGYQLKLDRADDPRLMRFIQKYQQNPLGPEPGAACTGGSGTPG